ncbi:UNVERIFIED_CONTAM: hypothetical protein FKN15_076234 [Acipenser sinensis]
MSPFIVEKAMDVLPLAPPVQPRQLTEPELRRLEEQEEDTLRELRIFLRNVTGRLIMGKRFRTFTKPVDLQEWWNDLPTDVRTAQSLTTFRHLLKIHLLKTHLFRQHL